MREEALKLPAFLRRDLLTALSYRFAFATDLLMLASQAVIFWFLGRMVDPAALPAYGGSRATYMEFAAIGIVITLVSGILLGRVALAIRQEQLMGTLESLLATPTSATVVQFGSAAFDLAWVPVRVAVFLAVVGLGFGLDFHGAGVLPAALLLTLFLPFLWGLGLISAGAILTFRRGAGATGLLVAFMGFASGAFFPVDLLPGWLAALAAINPLAVVLDGMRSALLGGPAWDALASGALVLIPASVVTMTAGIVAFRLALGRERRNGTLGLY